MRIPHSKPFISDEDVRVVGAQVLSGMHATGDKVREFEEKMAAFIGKKYAKATPSGTTALHLALLALGVKKGYEVIIPDFVCQSLMHAVCQTGATPILADVDSSGYNISLSTVKSVLTKKTKAIIVPHMFGTLADVDAINSLGVPVIEDCCQSLGAKFNGEMTGSRGLISVFSFYATKIISTGQGGMVLTSDEKIKERLDDLTTYDHRAEFSTSYNYGFTNVQAVLGISQLSRLSRFIERRREIEKKFDAAFSSIFVLPSRVSGAFTFRYVVGVKEENELVRIQDALKEKGITAEKPVYTPLHRYLDKDDKDFPNSIRAYKTALSIPLYPSLKDEEVQYVIESVLETMGVKNVRIVQAKNK